MVLLKVKLFLGFQYFLENSEMEFTNNERSLRLGSSHSPGRASLISTVFHLYCHRERMKTLVCLMPEDRSLRNLEKLLHILSTHGHQQAAVIGAAQFCDTV